MSAPTDARSGRGGAGAGGGPGTLDREARLDALVPFPALLARLRAGDLEAWDEFHRRYEPIVRRIARRWLSPSLRRQVDSTDVTQSVFRTVLEGMPGTPFEHEGRLVAWLETVTRHRVSRAGRREHGPRGRPVTGLDEATLAATGGLAPAEAAARAEDLHRLKVALDALPPAEREVVLLRDFEGLSFAEVATRCGRPTAEAARKVHDRACARLAGRLGTA